ncbi:MFS transporter [Pandoraea apista]|uniref:MFS transporter n=1 Tax=Pandoraea apista TaxID=93218 RepID=A0A5E5P7T7_9BURK|nr:MFS transporter [Pandoraea apista]AJE97151.1 MFS transporter [Pandoraea apista]AKH71107.1 MFS transporter [Pandoraea apista]AKI63378.1 MFS transporter [Pandoraea apista]OXS93571.1 MFS transporter [Pandoraea apista]PTE00298.1 MFS transporter [Pandoraea apista]
MATLQTMDISRLIDAQKPGRFAFLTIFCAWILMLTDGYELTALAYAAPSLVRDWQIPRAALGPAFGINVFGIMVGSILFGFLGDRFGRKRALLWGTVWYGVLTLATVKATSIDHLLVLRFLAGIGIGGAVPNAFVLISEFAPKRLRATWVTLMFTGYTLGASLGGAVAAVLVGPYGWHAIFLIGGVAPLAVAAVLAVVMPESLRFLVLKGWRPAEVVRLVRKIDPAANVDTSTRFFVGDEPAPAPFRWAMLFRGRLRTITPVLWLAYIANSMALFALQNWLPILVEAVGIPARQAALVSAMFSIGGTAGGLALMRFIDRYGARMIVFLPLFGCPLVALLGSGMPAMLLTAAVFLVGFCVAGTQSGLNAVAPTVYPSAIRGKGTGIAIGVAKIGSISGPMIGGLLLSLSLPVSTLFVAAAAPVAVVVLLALVLGRTTRRGTADDSAGPHPTPSSAPVTAKS